MKKIIFIFIIALAVITGCTGVKTVTQGVENDGNLEFLGNPKSYANGIDVIIDDNLNFKAEVSKENADRPKGKLYAISPGNHLISVKYNDQEIYKKQVFISIKETRQIILP